MRDKELSDKSVDNNSDLDDEFPASIGGDADRWIAEAAEYPADYSAGPVEEFEKILREQADDLGVTMARALCYLQARFIDEKRVAFFMGPQLVGDNLLAELESLREARGCKDLNELIETSPKFEDPVRDESTAPPLRVSEATEVAPDKKVVDKRKQNSD